MTDDFLHVVPYRCSLICAPVKRLVPSKSQGSHNCCHSKKEEGKRSFTVNNENLLYVELYRMYMHPRTILFSQ
jgi:hypothetical protein